MLPTLFYFFSMVSLSIGCFLLLRKYVPYSLMEDHNEIAGFIYAVVGVIYAVILAFVVIAVWEKFSKAEEFVENEVAHLVNLHRNANSFPDSQKLPIQSSCIQYAEDIIAYEWQEMDKGKLSPIAQKSYEKIWKVFLNYQPQEEYQHDWYALSISELNLLAESRRSRICSIKSDIHPFLWFLLFFGALVTIGFSYLFGTKSKYAHIIMIFCLSSSIALVLIIINAFEHPFHGIIKVSQEEFEKALAIMKSVH